MAIPAIAPYPMPPEAELPKNKVAWEADPDRCVLLIHDMQQYFLRAFTPEKSPFTELVDNIRSLKAHCAERGVPVIYSAQPSGQTLEQRGLLQDFWGPGLEEKADEEIIRELKPTDEDLVLTKWRYSAFQKSNLHEILRRYGRDQLIICGIYAHIGCLLTASDAFMKDIQPFLVADALGDFSHEYHRMALKYAAERCAVTLSARRLKEQLDKAKGLNHAAENEPLFTEQLIREQVAELLYESPSDIAENENLVQRGLDSVRMMSLVEKWRRQGVDVSFVEMAKRPTLAEWWKLVSSRLEGVVSNDHDA